MVAFTANYDLPYQQGGDEPCDAPEVWCDLADLANAAMSATHRLVDQVEPAVPAALVSLLTPLVVGGDPIVLPFDTVWMDTDGMVRPETSDRFVFPSRPGLYRVLINAEYLNGTATTNFLTQFVIATAITGFPGPYATNSFAFTAAANDFVGMFAPANNNHYRAAAVTNVNQAFINQSSTNAGGFGMLVIPPTGSTQTIRRAQMGVYYLREAVA